MDWRGILGIALSSAAAGLILGLVLGLRGCSDGGVTKLLEENAQLKVEVDRQRSKAVEADELRVEHAEGREAAERALAEMQAGKAAAADEVKRLRDKVRKAGRKRDERDELIDAYEGQAAIKDNQIDWLQAALDASKQETTLAVDAELALNRALVASEERADLLEKRVLKDRRKKAWIGVGSAVGGAGVMALGVYGAGRL
jgi:hypothetical protein